MSSPTNHMNSTSNSSLSKKASSSPTKPPVSLASLNALKRPQSSGTTVPNITKRPRKLHPSATKDINPFHKYVNATSRTKIKRMSSSISQTIKSAHSILDPSNIVKELIENSVDANAASIQIRIRGKAALNSIVVSDDGTGIPPQSHQTLCQPSTTSKLSTMSDFFHLNTYGFRGQALAAISALAGTLSITTRTQNMSVAVQLSYGSKGELLEMKDVPRTKGTTITVQNVFKRLPVRKEAAIASSSAELARVVATVQTFALALPHIAIQLRIENSLRVTAPVVTRTSQSSMTNNIKSIEVEALRSRAHAVLGRRAASPLLPFTVDNLLELPSPPSQTNSAGKISQEARCSIEALISPAFLDAQGSNTGRARSSSQYFFVNRRSITIPSLPKAVTELYRRATGLSSASPTLIMCINLPSWTFDINIAPDKTEIALWDEPTFVQRLLQELEKEWIPTQQSIIPMKNPQVQRVFPRQQLHGQSQGAAEDKVTNEIRSLNKRLGTPVIPKETAQKKVLTLDNLEDHGIKHCTQKPGASLTGNNCANNDDAENSQNRQSKEIVKKVNSDNDQYSSLHVPNEPIVSDDEITVEVLTGKESSPSASHRIESPDYQQKDNVNISNKQTVKDATANTKAATTTPNKSLELQARRQRFREKMLTSSGRQKPSILSFISRRKELNTSPMQMKSSNSEQKLTSQDEHPNSIQQNEIPTSISTPGNLGLTERGRRLLDMVDKETPNSEECKKQDKVVEDKTDGHKETTEQVYIVDRSPDSSRKRGHEPTPILSVDWEAVCSKAASLHENNYTSSAGKCDQTNNFISNFRSASVTNCSEDVLETYRQENADREMSRLFRQEWFNKMNIIGQFNRGFIICRLEDDLFIIDQHASDEKYNFEELQRSTKIGMQRLVRPIPLEMSAEDELIVLQHIAAFRAGGFDIDYRCGNAPTKRLYLRAQPISKHTLFVEDDLQDVINMLKSGVMQGGTVQPTILRPPRVRAMFASRACRKSVMIGDALPRNAMQRIVRNLSEIEHPWTCPHGRPTMRHLWTLPFPKQ